MQKDLHNVFVKELNQDHSTKQHTQRMRRRLEVNPEVEDNQHHTKEHKRQPPAHNNPQPSFILGIVNIFPYNLSGLWRRLQRHILRHTREILLFLFHPQLTKPKQQIPLLLLTLQYDNSLLADQRITIVLLLDLMRVVNHLLIDCL